MLALGVEILEELKTYYNYNYAFATGTAVEHYIKRLLYIVNDTKQFLWENYGFQGFIVENRLSKWKEWGIATDDNISEWCLVACLQSSR